ncbi:alpha/beta hydrolase [Flavobacteriaceae bacterium MHTCC 0001]
MFLDFKGTAVHYTDSGKGSAIVLLHGFLENATIWSPFVPILSKSHRVICIDLLGHGKSGSLGYIHTMELMAEAVSAILKHLKVKKVTLIGHSMGGYVTLAMAETSPNSILGLCLVNSTANADSIEKKTNRDRAIAVIKEDSATFIKIAIPNLFTPKNRALFSEEIEALKQEALKTPVQGMIAALEGMKIRKDRNFVLKNSLPKKMMVIGKKDPVLNKEDLLAQVKDANIEIVEFPDGHMSFIENQQDLLQEIMHFIE